MRRGPVSLVAAGSQEPPVSLDEQESDEWAWAPNYGGHIIAGGISSRQLWQWFDAEGLRYPTAVAALWYYLTMGLNEVVEDPTEAPGTAGAVGDIYFFEPVGMLLFSLDGAASFFEARERFLDEDTGAERITPELGSGLFLDRNGSLLVSLTLSGAERMEVNRYPGVLPGVFGELGVWVVLDDDGRPTVGLSTRRTLRLGFGVGR